MPTIQYPTLNVKYFAVNEIYLRGDDISVEQYCTDNSYNLSSYELENQRFSNDGALPYQYYDTSTLTWVTEFGFSKIVILLNYTV